MKKMKMFKTLWEVMFFFHYRFLEQWVKTCSFDFIAKDRCLVCLHNYEAGLHDILATLDATDYVDYILYRNMSNHQPVGILMFTCMMVTS